MDRGRGFAVSLFRIVDRRRTATGKRRSIASRVELWVGDLVVVQGSCRLPCFMAAPGTVNSFTKNSPGSKHKNRRIACPRTPDRYECSSIDNVGSFGCPVGQRMLYRHQHIGRRPPPPWNQRRNDYAPDDYAGLHGHPPAIQRKLALAPLPLLCNDRYRRGRLRNPAWAKFAAPHRLH